MKKSAGVLAYQKSKGKTSVLIGHMGGPFWSHKMESSWSIPKGEYTDEEPIVAAIREFHEETGFSVENEELTLLSVLKVDPNKELTIYTVEKYFDLSTFTCNTFELEWPPRSGNIQTFPELDRIEWVEIEWAKELVTKGQVSVLEQLEQKPISLMDKN